MARVNLSTSVRIGGVSVSFQITREQPGAVGEDPTLDAAADGQLTTRTNNVAGVVTAAGHGLAVNAAVALFWEGDSAGVAREGVVSNTTADTFTFAGCTGDSLPAVNTNLTYAPLNTVDVDFAGDNLVMLAVGAARRASVELQDASNAALLSYDLGKSGGDGEGDAWWDDGRTPNPLEGVTVARARVANGDSGRTNQIKFGALLNTVS